MTASICTILLGGVTVVQLEGLLPVAAWLAPASTNALVVTIVSMIVLATLGALGARTGGAPLLRGTLRVLVWGAIAMAFTAAVGALFGTVVG